MNESNKLTILFLLALVFFYYTYNSGTKFNQPAKFYLVVTIGILIPAVQLFRIVKKKGSIETKIKEVIIGPVVMFLAAVFWILLTTFRHM